MIDLHRSFEALLDLALAEDFGPHGDISSQAVFTDQKAHFRIICRQQAVIYGLWCVQKICQRIDSKIELTQCVADGAQVEPGTIICRFYGSVAAILAAERTILNFLGFLSGIASRTAEYVAIAQGLGQTKILDTRKTLPGFRLLAKAAVKAGGGHNHRMGLYDMVMLKDNHIDAAGSISNALATVRRMYGQRYKVEVECRNLADVQEALQLGADIIMLDNMSAEDCAQAVQLRAKLGKNVAFEASGDMDSAKIARYAGLGLDYISVGGLTHSVCNVNLSLGMEVQT